MTINEFYKYKFSSITQVKFLGEWNGVTEVWFREGKIGLKESGYLIDYKEVEDIRY